MDTHLEHVSRITSRKVTLTENTNGVNYKTTINLNDAIYSKESMFLVDLPEIKKMASYLKVCHSEGISPPKDCDYIIVNTEKEIAILVELKRTIKSASKAEIREQLSSGECWWRHLEFCLKKGQYEVYRLVVYCESRQQAHEAMLNEVQGFYEAHGGYFKLDFLNATVIK